MSVDLGLCDVCGVEPAVGVGAVPGAPVSLAYGAECLRRHTQPLFAVEVHTEQECPDCFEAENPHCPTCDGERWIGPPEGWNPGEHLAWWFLEETVYLNDKGAAKYGKPVGYCKVRDLFPPVAPWMLIVQKWRHHESMAAFHAAQKGA